MCFNITKTNLSARLFTALFFHKIRKPFNITGYFLNFVQIWARLQMKKEKIGFWSNLVWLHVNNYKIITAATDKTLRLPSWHRIFSQKSYVTLPSEISEPCRTFITVIFHKETTIIIQKKMSSFIIWKPQLVWKF